MVGGKVKIAKSPRQAKQMEARDRQKKRLAYAKKFPSLKTQIIKSLPVHQINKIRMIYESGHATVTDLAKQFNLHPDTVGKLVKYLTHIKDNRQKSLIEMQNCGEISPDHS